MKSLEQEYLEHSGVKGMKWGRRKAKEISNNVSAGAHLQVQAISHPIRSAKAISRETVRRYNPKTPNRGRFKGANQRMALDIAKQTINSKKTSKDSKDRAKKTIEKYKSYSMK